MRVRMMLDVIIEDASDEDYEEFAGDVREIADEFMKDWSKEQGDSRAVFARCTLYAYEPGQVNPYSTITAEAGTKPEGLV